jgi:integrase
MSRRKRCRGVHRLGPNVFEIRVRVVDPRTRSVKSKKQRVQAETQQQAEAQRPALRKVLLAELTGTKIEPPKNLPLRLTTLTDFAKLWIEDGAADRSIRFSTLETRKLILRRWVLPFIGDMPAASFRKVDAKDWLRRVRAERKPDSISQDGKTVQKGQPYAPMTVHCWYRTLRALVHYAFDELGIEDRDPFARLRVPMGESVRMTAANRFLAAAQEEPPDIRAMVLIGVLGGPRRGELLELRWSDIDRDEGQIRFSRSIYRGHVSKTKTDKARKIALPAILLEALDAHLRAQGYDNVARLPTGLVFPPMKTGKSRSGSFLTPHLRRICQRAGIEIRFTQHGLRRTANNLRRILGIDGTVIRSEMGHCSEKMTEHYSSVAASERKASMDRVIKAISEAQLAPKLAPSDVDSTTQPLAVVGSTTTVTP